MNSQNNSQTIVYLDPDILLEKYYAHYQISQKSMKQESRQQFISTHMPTCTMYAYSQTEIIWRTNNYFMPIIISCNYVRLHLAISQSDCKLLYVLFLIFKTEARIITFQEGSNHIAYLYTLGMNLFLHLIFKI